MCNCDKVLDINTEGGSKMHHYSAFCTTRILLLRTRSKMNSVVSFRKVFNTQRSII